MKLIKATRQDKETVEKILIQAATRIHNTGSTQWAHLLTNIAGEDIEAKIEQGDVVLAEKEERIVGVLYLSDSQGEWDQALWQEISTDYSAFYLHKLALADEFVGQNLASKILTLTQEMLQGRNDKVYLRLDCIATQSYLNQLYPKNGFELVGIARNIQAGSFKADFNLYQWQSF